MTNSALRYGAWTTKKTRVRSANLSQRLVFGRLVIRISHPRMRKIVDCVVWNQQHSDGAMFISVSRRGSEQAMVLTY